MSVIESAERGFVEIFLRFPSSDSISETRSCFDIIVFESDFPEISLSVRDVYQDKKLAYVH
jgi:hypothetical protein